jgi:hypothetical protein
MTNQEIGIELDKIRIRIIANYARSLVPALKDAGREHSAKELERLLFEYDVAVEEGGKFAVEHLTSLLGGKPL